MTYCSTCPEVCGVLQSAGPVPLPVPEWNEDRDMTDLGNDDMPEWNRMGNIIAVSDSITKPPLTIVPLSK